MRLTALKTIITSLLLIFTLPVQAEDDMPQAMIMGVFHFSNPASDLVKVDKVINVMGDEEQAYLNGLSMRIAEQFKPTIVMLEYDRKNDAVMQERYSQYLAGTYELPVNEVYQLGFRIAKAAGGVPIASFDEREAHWNPTPLFEVMPTLAPDIAAEHDQLIEALSAKTKEYHSTLSLKEYLQLQNIAERDRANMDIYLMTNSVGAGDKFEGALSSSSWWHRNFRMYANIQAAAKPGERVLAIGGQGHTAILKQLLDIDSHLEGVDVYPLF